MQSKKTYAHLAVLGANLIYGANYTIAKGVMPDYIGPFGFIVIRVVVSAIVFMGLDAVFNTKRIERRDLGLFALCGLFGVAINQLLFFKGLSLTTPINAALIMTTNPIMVMIVAAFLIKERVSIRKTSGIIIGLAGAVFLILIAQDRLPVAGNVRGDLLILINSLSFGVFLIIVKPLMQKYHPVTVMKWVFIFGMIYVTPVGFREFSEIEFSTFPMHIWLSVAYVVIVTTCIVYLLNTFALRHLSPSNVSTYIYLQPVFATLFAVLLGKDELHILHVISSSLIFTGVYLVSSSRESKQIKKS